MSEIEQLKKVNKVHVKANTKLIKTVLELEKKLEQAREFMCHTERCNFKFKQGCDCGYDDFKKGLK